MNTWLSFVNGSFAGPVCLVITIVGLVLSAIAWRKKGARSGIRGIAWSLLPFAIWLTHALSLVGRIVSAVVQFAGSFAFSPKAWLGIILLLVAALLFLVSGGIPLVRGRRKRERDRSGSAGRGGGGGEPAAVQTRRSKAAVAPADDDDLSDVRDILKRHGIS